MYIHVNSCTDLPAEKDGGGTVIGDLQSGQRPASGVGFKGDPGFDPYLTFEAKAVPCPANGLTSELKGRSEHRARMYIRMSTQRVAGGSIGS